MKRTVFLIILVFSLLLNGCVGLPAPEEAPDSCAETTLPTDDLADTSEPQGESVQTGPVEPSEPQTEPVQTEPAEPPAISAGFGAVYADICLLLESGDREREYSYVSSGMMEIVMFLSTEQERYKSITYALEDVDDDGNSEMIVLDAMEDTRILAVFAIRDGQILMTHEGWARARLYRLSDGAFYMEGSNGAAYSVFEAYGQRWFTYPKGEDQQEAGFYHAADGSYDPGSAREITREEYDSKQAELVAMITAFSTYSFGSDR